MSREHFQPPPFPHRPGLVQPVRVDPWGASGPTKGQANGPGWRRSSRGLYVPAHVDREVPEQRIVEAAATLPAYGGVTGWAALRWCGGWWFEGLTAEGRGERPVVLATGPSDVRSQQGTLVSAEGLDPRDLTEVDGLRLTSLVRAVCFEMRYASSERQAVLALDMAAYHDLVSIAELAAYAALRSSWTGIPRCRKAIPRADENSWSPREVLMRLVWVYDAGRPRPLCNAPVFDNGGRHVGTPDLLDPDAGVVGEYDGALHLEASRRHRDLAREEAFRRVGLEYVTMVAADWRDTRGFLGRLHAAYERAALVPRSRRTWTLDQPHWWVDTSTVAARRALTEEQRTRWLGHRAA